MNQTLEPPTELLNGSTPQSAVAPAPARPAEPRMILMTTRAQDNVVEVPIGGQNHCYLLHVRPPAAALLLVMVNPAEKRACHVWVMSIARHRYLGPAQLIMQIANITNSEGRVVAVLGRSQS